MSHSQDLNKQALIISYSEIDTDPRVRRQVDWLVAEGWSVDTVGLGTSEAPEIAQHYELGATKSWLQQPFRLAAATVFLPRAQYFNRTLRNRIPASLRDKVSQGLYGLYLFNEVEFLPWLRDIKRTHSGYKPVIHVDLHEYREPGRRRNTLGGRLSAHHYRWTRNFIGDTAFTSRTAVNTPIAELYAEEFGFETPTPLRNIPNYVELEPSKVLPSEIKLLFHGMASFARGFTEILEAMTILPENFTMTFMLMPNEEVHAWLNQQIENHPARDRLLVVPPAPMRTIPERINEYDLEIILYRPLSHNLEYALPNKFFESIQGRLGLVVGEGKTMAPLVREWRNGVIVPGFEGVDLAATLSQLSIESITEMKAASSEAAKQLNAEKEGKAFIQLVLGK